MIFIVPFTVRIPPTVHMYIYSTVLCASFAVFFSSELPGVPDWLSAFFIALHWSVIANISANYKKCAKIMLPYNMGLRKEWLKFPPDVQKSCDTVYCRTWNCPAKTVLKLGVQLAAQCSNLRNANVLVTICKHIFSYINYSSRCAFVRKEWAAQHASVPFMLPDKA